MVVLATFNMVMRSTLGINPKAQDGNKNIVLEATDRAMEVGTEVDYTHLLLYSCTTMCSEKSNFIQIRLLQTLDLFHSGKSEAQSSTYS